MAPLKFEDNIREQLEQRTIQPSKGSWDKLKRELDDQEGGKPAKKNWWLGIAASIVGFLVITTVFMTANKSVKNPNIDVVSTKKEIIEDEKSTELVEKINIAPKTNIKENQLTAIGSKQSAQKEGSKKQKTDNIKQTTINKSTEIIPKNVVINKVREGVVQADVDASENQLNEQLKSPLGITPEIIDNKIASIAEKVKELEKSNSIVTDQEVEALLRQAQQEITTQQILKSNTVNASALLLDVESELDASFKNRVFEALKTGFEKLKTTVVERDN